MSALTIKEAGNNIQNVNGFTINHMKQNILMTVSIGRLEGNRRLYTALGSLSWVDIVSITLEDDVANISKYRKLFEVIQSLVISVVFKVVYVTMINKYKKYYLSNKTLTNYLSAEDILQFCFASRIEMTIQGNSIVQELKLNYNAIINIIDDPIFETKNLAINIGDNRFILSKDGIHFEKIYNWQCISLFLRKISQLSSNSFAGEFAENADLEGSILLRKVGATFKQFLYGLPSNEPQILRFHVNSKNIDRLRLLNNHEGQPFLLNIYFNGIITYAQLSKLEQILGSFLVRSDHHLNYISIGDDKMGSLSLWCWRVFLTSAYRKEKYFTTRMDDYANRHTPRFNLMQSILNYCRGISKYFPTEEEWFNRPF